MADKRISQLVERTTLANNDVLPIVASGASTTNKVTLQTIEDWMQGNLNFGVTSVAISVPTGLTVTGSPITSTGTFIIGFAAGYSIPTNTKQSEWDSAYNDKINSVAVTGTTTKTITLTQQDGGTLSAQWSDLQPVTSVFGRTGDVVAVEGDYSLDQLSGVGITSPSSGQVLKYDGTNWVNATEQYVGTVTSVGVSVPAAFSVTGSPITTSGTITISGAGTSAQYIDGTGSLQTFPNLIAQATNLVREVYNNSGATMTKGTVVYINGGHGNLPTIAKAKADADSTSAQTYGVVQANISDQSNGYIVVVGDLTNIDTQGYLEGTQLYLSGTTAGNYTSTKPYAPIHIVYVGIVTRSHPTQGIIAIKIQNGYEMDEIHDVDAQNPSDNDILQYKTATGLWTKTAGTTTNIAEGTNLYYTNERARQSISETITGIDYDNTTGVFSTTSGYGIPTTAKQTQWDAAYNDKINSASVSGTTTKTLTLTQQDGGTITTSWSDYDTAPVTSVFGRTGAIVATEGDYNLTQLGDVTITTPSNGEVLKYNGTTWVNDTGYVGTVTSVGLSVPTGLSVSGSPITTSGTLAISLASGYSIPTTASQTNWDAAYNDKINSAAVTGTTTKTLTLTQQDGGTITASWTDINTDAVTSVFGRTGAVVATEGDYTLTQLGDVTITTPTNGQFLKYDGTTWINAAAGTVTSVALATGTTGTDVGVTGSPITGAGTITLNIPVASATNTGKLSSTDWSTFNGKQAALNGTGFVKISGTTISYDNNTYVDTTNAQYINGFKTFYEGISVQPTSSTTTPINFTTSMNSSQSQPVAANFGFAWIANANNQIFTGVYITAANPTNPSGYTGLQTYALRTSGNVKFAGSSEATSFIKTGGTSSQFLKADGSVDSSTYLTSETDTLSSVVARGSTTTATISVGDDSLGTTGINIKRGRLCFSNSYEENHSIYNNFKNLDGLGAWDGMKMETYLGLDIKTGNATAPSTTIVAVRPAGVTITGNISATNLSGTNTGDQTLAGLGGVPTSRTLTINGTAYDLTADRSWTITGTSQWTTSGANIYYNVSGGYVTIGSTAATNKFLVIGSQTGTQAATIPIAKFVNTGNAFSKIILGSDNANYDAVVSMDNSATLADCRLRFYIGNGTNATAGHSNDQFVVTGNGSVGFGTIDPIVHSNTRGVVIKGSARGILELWDGTTGKSVFQQVSGDTYVGQLDKGTGSGRLYLLVNGNGTSADVAVTFESNKTSVFGASTQVNGYVRTLAAAAFYADHTYTGINYNFGGGETTDNVDYKINGGATWTSGGNFRWWTQTGNATPVEAMRIQPNRFVSIGGVTAGSKLTIYDGDIRLYKPHVIAGGASWKANINFTDEVDRLGARIVGERTAWDGAPMGIGFDTGGVGTVTRRLSIASDGVIDVRQYMTIGTNINASSYLVISENQIYRTGGGDFYINNSGTASNVRMVENGGSVLINTGTKWNQEKFGIQISNSAAWASVPAMMRLTNYVNGGKPKITFTDSSIIDGNLGMIPISGGSYFVMGFAGATEEAFKVYQNGNVVATGDVTAYSDARLKTNIKTIDNALQKVMSMRGVSYNRIDTQIDKTKIGLIAQEVKDVIPEVVDMDNEGMHSVSYGNLVSVLIEAVKEQQKQIEELKKQVA